MRIRFLILAFAWLALLAGRAQGQPVPCSGCVDVSASCSVVITGCPESPIRVGSAIRLFAVGDPGGGACIHWDVCRDGYVYGGGGLVDGCEFEFRALYPGRYQVRVTYQVGGSECMACCTFDVMECQGASVAIQECRPWHPINDVVTFTAVGAPEPGFFEWTYAPPTRLEPIDDADPNDASISFRILSDEGPATVGVRYTALGCTAEDECTFRVLPDSDGDGRPDIYDPTAPFDDTDQDGISDRCEALLGTNGGIGGENEWPDPARDFDGDGLSDVDEVCVHGTDPTKFDTDEDGVQDLAEILLGLNPGSWRTDGGTADRHRPEYLAHDRDNDLVYDEFEERIGLDPSLRDQDGDGIIDGIELRRSGGVSHDAAAFFRRASPDSDVDGLSDWEERFVYGSDPDRYDTDGDLLPDGFEVMQCGTDPTDMVTGIAGLDSYADSDYDGLTNYEEYSWYTDPHLADTDGDGVWDAAEIAGGGLPTDPSDGGGPMDPDSLCTVTMCLGPADSFDDKQFERYEITVGPHRFLEPEVGPRLERCVSVQLRRGECYPIRIRWAGRTGPLVHFNYTARVLVDGEGACACYDLYDPNELLGSWGEGNSDVTEDRTDRRMAWLCFGQFDLDIDADNTAGLGGGPDGDDEEEEAERDEAGMKVVIVNRDDTDGDGVLDYADGFDRDSSLAEDNSTPGESFTPVVVRIEGLSQRQRESATVTFEYDDADVGEVRVTPRHIEGLDGITTTVREHTIGSGLLRLWRKDGGESRTAADFVRSGQAYPVGLFGQSEDEITLYVEAVNGSATPVQISARLDAVPGTCGETAEIKVLPLDPFTGIDPSLDQYGIAGYVLIRGTGGIIHGTDGNDIIIGSADADIIRAYAGNDIILPGGGDDCIDSPGDCSEEWGGANALQVSAGCDLIFSWHGSKRIAARPGEDTVVYIEGNRFGAARLSNQTTENPSWRPDRTQAADGKPFHIPHIIAAYRWAFGNDDIWRRAFEAGGGRVLAVEGDGYPFSYWDVDWILDPNTGVWIGFNVKIQYNIGSVVDAAMALRRAILEKVARWPNIAFENFLLDQFQSFSVDQVTNDRAFEAWGEMRRANVAYAQRGARLVAELYYDIGWGLAAGVGADIVSVIVTLPETIEATPEVMQKLYETVVLLPGAVANAFRDRTGNQENFLDGLLPPDRSEPPPSAPPPQPGELPELSLPRAARVVLDVAGHSAGFVKDVVRFTPEEGVTSPIGFVWRRDLLPGGDTAAVAIEWVENGARRVPLVGTAQQVRLGDGTLTTHHSTILRVARELARSPDKQYLYIGLNRSVRTMVADATEGLRLTDNIDRPDIIAVYWDPVANVPKVEMYEIPSGTQSLEELLEKIQIAMESLPIEYRTTPDINNIIYRDP